MPLVFNQYLNSPPSPTATYYAQVLTSIPTGTEATVSALSLANPSGYAPMSITVTTSIGGAITNWSFSDAAWSALNWTAALYGTAIVLQIGASKDPTIDKPFLFYEFENGLHAPIVLTPGYFGLRFSNGAGYAFSTQAASKYDVGAFIGYPLYKDLLTLLESNNGTRYTPVSALTLNQFYSVTYNVVINPDFLCYWIGDRAMVKELQSRHDIFYNNVTFPALASPSLGFSNAATFNGIDSYLTIGNTTLNGSDFNFQNSGGFQGTFLMYFFPTSDATEEILLDTTTDNNSGGYIVRKTITNKIEIGYLSPSAPHSIAAFASANQISLNGWNFIMVGNYYSDRILWLNGTITGFSIGFNSPSVPNGIRLGARRGLSPTITGANFTGKILYYVACSTYKPDGPNSAVVNNRDIQAPYNQAYKLGWSQTGSNDSTEMTVPNGFPSDKNTFLRSFGNLDTYVGAQNLASSNTVSHFRIDHSDCFYINFGQNKVRPGTIALVFPTASQLSACKLDTATNSAAFSIWGANTLPGNTPTNVNLSNPALWDKFDFTINGIDNSGNFTDISGLSLITSGGYRYYLLNTSITKYFKYLKMGWKNVVSNGVGGGTAGYAYYLLYNSSVLSSKIDLVPPTSGYAA